MKVPRINLGVQSVYQLDNFVDGRETVMTIFAVDYIAKRFSARDYHRNEIDVPFERYNPAPTMNNFLRAITEWDYHYRASDDPRRYEEGREQEQALIALLKELPAADQHQLQKIVEIVVISNTP